MENMVNPQFWRNKKVLVTGHTGFKGGWLSLWLHKLGAKVYGLSLEPSTSPILYHTLNKDIFEHSYYGDIRDDNITNKIFATIQPEIIFHLAAQPIVRQSYSDPRDTYSTNIMGSLNILEGIRQCGSVRSAVMISTDKCYKNQEWQWPYREVDELGGYDPYSSSKACMEILVESFVQSYFNAVNYREHKTAIATARAGNVIGGGDWSNDRLLPDIIRSHVNKETLNIRNTTSTRPWQHVLEPLNGYLLLAERLYNKGIDYNGPWNFGPSSHNHHSVESVLNQTKAILGETFSWSVDNSEQPHEATLLALDSSKASSLLKWQSRWSFNETLQNTLAWYDAFYQEGPSSKYPRDMTQFTLNQIDRYESA